MQRRILWVTGLSAALLLAFSIGTASANRLSTNEQRFDAQWNPLTFIAGGNTVRCPLTLEGSFHTPTIAKVANSLIGHISRASVRGGAGAGECTGIAMTVLTATLPWHVTYNRFGGTLPRITRLYILLVGLSLQIQPTGSLGCLMRTTTTNPALLWVEVDTATGAVDNINAEEAQTIPLMGSGGLCFFAGSGRFAGAGVADRLGSTTPITIRLI